MLKKKIKKNKNSTPAGTTQNFPDMRTYSLTRIKIRDML